MILEHEQWCFGYDQILKDCRSPDATVLLLCNADVDAMSSARILSYMLRSDGIHYQLLPCHNYSQLLSTIKNNSEVAALVLLNFGASYNLANLYQTQALPETTKTYVLDCRRPIHLANVYAKSSVVVFLDSTQKLEELPSDGDNLSGDDSSSSSESDSDSDDSDDDEEEDNDSDNNDDSDEEEANFDDVIGERKTAQEHLDPSYDAEDEDNSKTDDHDEEDENKENNHDNDDNNDDHGLAPPESKRLKTQETTLDDDDQEQWMPSLSPRELHRLRKNRLRKYYSDGSFYGSPSSFVAYQLASRNRYGEQSDLLWLACVGVTDAYLHSRLDLIGYARLAKDLSGICSKLFPSSFFDRALNTVYAEDLSSSAHSSSNPQRTKIALSENGRIVSEKDFRFFLLRHSSLLDSMQYSDYVCTKLQLYTKQGEQRLLELLAKMGYPLDECKQPFSFMKPGLRRRLKEKLTTHAKEYNLDRFEFTSFTRVTGYSSLLSASDTSYAVTALLEYEPPSDDQNSDGNSSLEAFHNAYDALGSHCSEPLRATTTSNEGYDSSNLINGGTLPTTYGIGAGLRYAMVLQKSILHTAIGLVERGGITLLRHFRYAHVTSSSTSGNSNGHLHLRTNDLINKQSGDFDKKHNLFSKPLALTRLAHFLMDMHRENGKWTGTRARPLLLIADKPASNTCLIVGYEHPERAGDFVRNAFGKRFELTAKSMNGKFCFDSFDSNVVEVDAGDAQRFMEQLHYLLDAM